MQLVYFFTFKVCLSFNNNREAGVGVCVRWLSNGEYVRLDGCLPLKSVIYKSF